MGARNMALIARFATGLLNAALRALLNRPVAQLANRAIFVPIAFTIIDYSFNIMRKVSLERYYFVLYNGALTLKMSKMALNLFCDKTLHMPLNHEEGYEDSFMHNTVEPRYKEVGYNKTLL